MIKSQYLSLPNNWKIIKLKDLVDVKSGKRLPKGESYSENLKKNPYIRIIDFHNFSIRTNNLKYLTPDLHEKLKQYIITDKDVYLAIVGSTIGLVGKIPSILNGAHLTENAARLVIKDFSILAQDYLIYYLASHKGQLEIHKRKTVTSVPKLAFKRIEKIPVILPPIIEQHKIILILSNLDNLIFQTDTRIEELQHLKKGLMQRLFTEGIGHTEFKETRVGKIPKGWEIVKLKEIVTKDKFAIVDGPFGTQLHSEEYVNEGVPLIRINDITIDGFFNSAELTFIKEEKFQELKRSAIYPGDVLLAKTGATIGKVCIFPNKFEKGLIASSCAKISVIKSSNIFYHLSEKTKNLI